MGRLGWDVSALGFGAMRLPVKLGRVNEAYATEIIRRGIDLGINYIDTAWMYHLGQSEQLLGKILKDGYREKIHLVTKLPVMLVRKAEQFDSYLAKQMEKLQTDYLDLYLFHHMTLGELEKVKRLGLMRKMEKAKDEGLIKGIGFSFHDTLPAFKEVIDSSPLWDMAQIQYNYMDTGVQATTEGLRYAHEKGLAVVIMEPVKGGVLANPSREALDVMKKAPVQRTPVDWALQFLWNKPEVSCVLSGMGSMKMVEENCASADRSGIGTLSEEEVRVINDLAGIYRKHILVPCTACQYCMPCPSGVNIPQNFAFINNKSFLGFGSIASKATQWMVTGRYRNLAKNKAQLAARPNSGNASLCTRCNACIPKCPQGIKIPDMLEKVDLVFGRHKRIHDVFTPMP